MDLIELDVIGLSTSPESDGAYALILGEVGGARRLPIIIGAFEAQAIACHLEKIIPPRPMTHDLLHDTVKALGGEVIDVIIDELLEGSFLSKIRYVQNGREGQLDARPSDAVALAVRFDAPIYAKRTVIDESGIYMEERFPESDEYMEERFPENDQHEWKFPDDQRKTWLKKMADDMIKRLRGKSPPEK